MIEPLSGILVKALEVSVFLLGMYVTGKCLVDAGLGLTQEFNRTLQRWKKLKNGTIL